MVRHTQTILRQKPSNGMSVLDHFVGLALKGLRNVIFQSRVGINLEGYQEKVSQGKSPQLWKSFEKILLKQIFQSFCKAFVTFFRNVKIFQELKCSVKISSERNKLH